MYNCITITRAGKGDVFGCDSFEDADRHPLIQYGDAIITAPSKLMTQVTFLELPDFLDRLDDHELRQMILSSLSGKTHDQKLEVMKRYYDMVWQRLCSIAENLPTDPDLICNLVRRDRELSIEEGKTTMTKTEAPENKAAKAPKPPKYAPDAKIVMLSDKEGKAYGKANNPKRAGTKAAERFALYDNGVSVGAFLKNGGTTADLDYDTSKGYVKVE